MIQTLSKGKGQISPKKFPTIQRLLGTITAKHNTEHNISSLVEER